ncbi:YfjI family protein [Orbus wheelerorum]|uniref:YfjI family protein n=1 Tax=Orbus wheelerorum TaxID=3074111 RepID=UPI00370DD69E
MSINNSENHLDINNLISEVSLITQAPKPLIFGSILSVLSSVLQGMIDVEVNPNLRMPISLFILTLAGSGERKSTVDNLLRKVLIEKNNHINEKNEQMKSIYQGELDRWDIERKNIQKQYKKSLSEPSSDAVTSQLYSELLLMHEKKPKTRLLTNILYNDITIEALLSGLSGDFANTTLSSSDAGNLFNRLNYQYLSSINQLWDGDTIQINRKKEGAFVVKNARLSMSLMIQPKTFDDIVSKKGRIRDTGALARMLFIKSPSTQGERLYTENSDHTYLDAFYDRITAIYDKSYLMAASGVDKIVVILSPEAKEEWINFYNDIESELGKGNLGDISDYASKIANNVARVAALLQVYEHDNTQICKSCMMYAIEFGYNCIESFKSVFGEKTIDEKAKELADILFDWLNKNSDNGYKRDFLKAHIYKYGPNQLRNKENLEMALYRLHNDGDIDYFYRSKPVFIRLRKNNYLPR